MQKTNKKLLAVFLSISLLISVLVPAVAFATTGTLGTETPKVYCSFSSEGTDVDGNDLTAGTYDVSFHLKGVANISILQLTADYDQTIMTVNSQSVSMADSFSDIETTGGSVITGGNLVFGFYSLNKETTSAIDSTDTIIATINVTLTAETATDFADIVSLHTNPNETFIQADYGDASYDCYALVTSFEGYEGTLYQMTADLSPSTASTTYSVTGTTYQMINMSGSTGNVAPNLTVTVGELSTTTGADGTFTLTGLTNGEYSMVISGDTTIDRTITITVNDGDIAIGDIAIVCCDYSKDSYIDSRDMGIFLLTLGNTEKYDVYYDFDGNSYVDSRDQASYLLFSGQDMSTVYNGIQQ